ncbi:hypothetical protein [Paraburkholderia sp. UCT2]|uniref:hypothetical protein n=1 Tax=Paraburkholderia sp. UCT2 TaxID=2615208 RepID=UPI00165518F9|nr:hypothetical protein [Paraburkholderia sp. UCT2]MBC8727519.1 hypothetical protein [Paraburkholderia sp. UCT2]
MPFMDIAAGEISSIQPVEANNKNVVLLISQRNASRPLVVKSEDGAGRNNVGAMLEFHATAFSRLRGLPFETAKLSLKEIDELKRCDPAKVKANPPLTQTQWLQKLDDLLHTADRKVKTAIKVSFVEELANLHGIGKDLEQKKLLGDALVRGNTDVPFGLGEILAVDFFIGNGDRFREVNSGEKYPRGSILGDQNIFFQIKYGKFTAVGLDTYDGAGPWSDLNRTIEDLEATNKNLGVEYALWPGRILAPGARRERDEVATALVDSLIELCFGNGVGFSASMRKKLIEACHRGISSGKEMLRGKYKLGDNVQSLTEGIRSRWLIIRGK